MKQNVVVLFARPYSIKDEKTGRVNEGISVHYLLRDSLAPVQSGDWIGVMPSKVSVPLSEAPKLQYAPALYEADIQMVQKGQQIVAKPVSFEYVSNLN